NMDANPDVYPHHPHPLPLRSRLLLTTTTLRSRMSESLRGSQIAFERRLSDPADAESPPLAVRTVALACVAALTTAITVWVEQDGDQDLPTLIHRAFDALETAGAQDG